LDPPLELTAPRQSRSHCSHAFALPTPRLLPPSTPSGYVLDPDRISTRTCIPQSVNHIKCHRRGTHFFVHSLAVLKNAPLSFFNCCIQSQFWFGSPRLNLTTYRCYLRLKRIIGTRIIHLFLDDGKHYSKSYNTPLAIFYSSPVARVIDGFHWGSPVHSRARSIIGGINSLDPVI
jgi:hypothetical protein